MSERYLSPAETARQLGVSVRALRLYERRRLLKAHRTEVGWRAYGPLEIERLHQVLTLKSLGLSLSRIAELINGKVIKLDTLLAAHEAVLVERRAELDRALDALTVARARLENGERLSLDDLIQLTKETTMSDWPNNEGWKSRLDPIFRRKLTAEQYDEMFSDVGERLSALGLNEAAFHAAWRELIARTTRLMQAGETESDEARAVLERLGELASVFTKGKEALSAGAAGALFEALSDPAARRDLPISPELIGFFVKLAAKQPYDPPKETEDAPRVPVAVVRELIEGWRSGSSDEGPETRRMLPTMQAALAALGDLQEVSFMRRDGEADIFALSFSEARMFSAIRLGEDGRVATASLRSGWQMTD